MLTQELIQLAETIMRLKAETQTIELKNRFETKISENKE